MYKKTILRTLTAITLLTTATACKEEARVNPLIGVNQLTIGDWLYNNAEGDGTTSVCADIWRLNLDDAFAKTCNDSYAPTLAKKMKDAGFGDVRKEDVKLGTMWEMYNTTRRKKLFHTDKTPKHLERRCLKSEPSTKVQGKNQCTKWADEVKAQKKKRFCKYRTVTRDKKCLKWSDED